MLKYELLLSKAKKAGFLVFLSDGCGASAGLSQLYQVSEPYFEGNAGNKIYAATYTYDSYGRISNTATPMGNTQIERDYISNISYAIITSPEAERVITYNMSGQTIEERVNNKAVTYTYYPSGLLKTATPEDGQAISMEYDLQGNRTKLTDPDAGVITSKYDGWGQLTQEKQKINPTADSVVTSYYYLPSGLPDYKTRNGETTYYGYDSYYRQKWISIAGKHGQGFTYDQYDRIIQSNDTIDGNKVYIHKTDYDLLGNVSTETYPGGYYITNKYDKYGNLTEITEKYGKSVWKAVDSNAKGQLTYYSQGNNSTSVGIDSRGFPTSIVCPNIINLAYNFNTKGNLDYRQDNISTYKESFNYDTTNRLLNWSIYKNNVLQKSDSVTFNPTTGNIATKSDIGNFEMYYGENGKPHALTSISGVPTGFPVDNLIVTYTDFKKIKTLTEGAKTYTLSYGVDEQRTKSVYAINGVTQLTRYYLGDYEEEVSPNGNLRKIHYLGNGAIFITNNGKDSLLFMYSDYLGSPAVLTDYYGNVLEKYAFDPWGNRRNPADWTQKDTRTSWQLSRGYTGHEHLDAFGIINMNGRVYDPLTAQFFSPDPYLQAPGDWLNYNRYSYCLNNPLKYTDPDGEWNWLVSGIGFVYGYVSYGLMNDDWGWKALGNGALTGVMWGVGYTNEVAKAGITPLLYAGQSALTSTVNQFLPSTSIPISNNFSIGASFGLGISPGGLVWGMNFSGTYHSGDFALTGGIGASGNMSSWGGGISYDDSGISYYRTTYDNATGPDGKPNNQIVGGFGIDIKDFSFRLENDLNFKLLGVTIGGDGKDRWRTSAVEFGYKNFVIGTSVYTNAPDEKLERDPAYTSKFWDKLGFNATKRAYADSKVYSSPLYIGVKQGGRVTRIGLDQPWVQDMTQNGVHLFLSKSSPLFYTPYGEYSSAYRYSGYYNPYSLYSR